MRRTLVLVVCLIGVPAVAASAQSLAVAPLQVKAGTVLSFQLQTRMKATAGDALSALPKGTVLRVKMLDSVDSGANRDGTPFHGLLVSSLISENRVLVHSEAEVRGLLALLRSSSHPEGFRYELLLTGLVDRGEPYTLTAFLDPATASGAGEPAAESPAEAVKSGSAKRIPIGQLPSHAASN